MKDKKYLSRLFIFSLIYFLFGKLCLELAIPVGVASPIWPSAGIAAAVLIRYGVHYFPGAFIGSYCTSIGLLLFINQSQSLLNSIAVVAVIALAGMVHAIVSAKLVKYFIGNGAKITSDGVALLKLFTIAIIPAGIISSLIGTLGLYFGNIVPADNFGYSMFNWWIGDSLGVVSFTPLCLFLFYEEKGRRLRSAFNIGAPLIISVTLVGSLFYYLDRDDRAHIKDEFERHTRKVVEGLNAKFSDYSYVLDAVEGFYLASKYVDREEFQSFIKPFLKNYEAIQAIGWIPKVEFNKKSFYENQAKKDGIKNFKIKEKSDTGKLLPVSKRELYYPVYYLEPAQGNSKALGFDLASNSERKQTLKIALEKRDKEMTKSLKLVQGDKGTLIVSPVFKNDRHLGYISLVVKINTIINSTKNDANPAFRKLLLYETTEKGEKDVLYNDFPESEGIKSILKRSNLDKKGFLVKDELNLFGQKWGVIQFLTNEYIVSHKPLTSWIILVVGFLLAGLLTTIFVLESGRTKKIEQLVEIRTDELRNAQRAMVESSKFAALGEMAGGIAHEINNPLAIIQGYAERIVYLADEKNLEANEIKGMSEKICETNLRISKIISGLRSFAREESDHEKVNISLSQVLDDSVALCQEKFKANGVSLNKININESVKIKCHPTQISQVILNLLNNAFDEIKDDPKESWIEVEMVNTKDLVKLFITDSGKGIKLEIIEKVMQPFFTTKSYGHGTGLGLSISKGIIESHGGTLIYDSDYKNTRFIISLKKST